MTTMIQSNIVSEDKVRSVQRDTLNVISNALVKSFGPNGSTTGIIKNMDKNGINIAVEHTKDGYTIMSNIQFLNPIERSVQDLLTDLTRYVVKEVGDGTTSAVVLCNAVFEQLCNNASIANCPAADTIYKFTEVISKVKEEINKMGRECTVDDIYEIALISTNNNEEIAGIIREIYKKYDMNVFIDVGTSNQVFNVVKEYDGMTLDTGFANVCMVNDAEKNTASVRNPRIYCFNDPIDTPEMLTLLDTILYSNIMRCYERGSVYEPVPTVIFCKQISPDTSSYFESVVKLMNAVPNVPLLIVSDIHQHYIYEDIAQMCGAKFIKKYLNPDLQQKDIDAGLAPTTETILEFCGSAELVVADEYKTKIIRPKAMYNEDGTYSDAYNTQLKYLEAQIKKATNEDAGVMEIQKAKRRYNSFKGNMVDLLIGGIALSDRNNLKASVDDAVLNCRSAAINGVGYGANYMAFSVLHKMKDEATAENGKNNVFVDILCDAYDKLVSILYNKTGEAEKKELIDKLLENKCPLNIRTNEYDQKVLSSIKTDTSILDTINRILMLMFTSNQYLVQTPMHNIYSADER